MRLAHDGKEEESVSKLDNHEALQATTNSSPPLPLLLPLTMPSRKLEYNTDSTHQRDLMKYFMLGLDIEWPHPVKLNATAMRKRLVQGLDYAQDWETISKGRKGFKVDLGGVGGLTEWKDEHPDVPVWKASRRFSFEENPMLMDDGTPEGILAQNSPNFSPFVGLRRMYVTSLLLILLDLIYLHLSIY